VGVPVLRGRSFDEGDHDNAPRVVMLSEAAARHYWPGATPLGQRLGFGPGPNGFVTMIGIVPETRYRALREARPSIYFPLRQSIFPFAPMSLAIRTTGSEQAAIPAIRTAVAEVDPGVAFRRLSPFRAYLDQPMAQPRLNAFLLTMFAGAAALLASVGLFGVTSAMIRRRTRELGIRLALGATVEGLRRLVIGRGVLIAAVGVSVGVAGAVFTNRMIEALLFQVQPSDASTFAAVVMLLLMVAAAAGAIAAHWSLRVDPAEAFREGV
jgi:putative ABC transport system permease protein